MIEQTHNQDIQHIDRVHLINRTDRPNTQRATTNRWRAHGIAKPIQHETDCLSRPKTEIHILMREEIARTGIRRGSALPCLPIMNEKHVQLMSNEQIKLTRRKWNYLWLLAYKPNSWCSEQTRNTNHALVSRQRRNMVQQAGKGRQQSAA